MSGILAGLGLLNKLTAPVLLGGGALYLSGLPEERQQALINQGLTGLDTEGYPTIDYGLIDQVLLKTPFGERLKKDNLIPAINRKIKKQGISDYPQFAEMLSNPDLPAYEMGQDPMAYVRSNLADHELSKRRKNQADQVSLAKSIANIDTPASRRADKQLEFNLEELKSDRQYRNRLLETKIATLDQQGRRDFQLGQEKIALQNRIALNDNALAMAKLGLQEQESANRYSLYQQELEDRKDLRRNAMYTAALDGLGLTLAGLIG